MGARVRLCGQLEVDLGGGRVEQRLPGRQGPLVVALLVLNRHRPVARDELIGALWPGDAPADPDEALSALLSKVRQAIGRDALAGRRELTLVLPADAQVDVEQALAGVESAEAAVARGDWHAAWEAAAQAGEITRQAFLVGHDGPWVEDRRRELQDARLSALEALAAAGVALGGARLGEAERAARELTRLAPLREAGHRLLMEALAARGEVAEALAAYEDLRVLIRDELGVTPSEQVRALHERLLTGGAAAPEAVPLPAPLSLREEGSFVGREPELERLRGAWADACSGHRRLVFLSGGPGIGKSRLSGELAREALAEGTVLYGVCEEEMLVSYQPFVEALRHYVRHAELDWARVVGPGVGELARLIPELAAAVDAGGATPAGDPQTRCYLMFEAVSALLTEAARTPLVLVLDDLHWADRGTLQLLRHVTRAPQQASLLILGTYRDAEVGAGHPMAELLADLRRDRQFERISLDGLDERGVGELITTHAGDSAPGGIVQTVYEQTDGNPFFVEEVMRHLLETGALFERGGRWRPAISPDEIGVPEGVKDVVGWRVARLSEGCRTALSQAAVLGRVFDFDVLQAMGDFTEDALISALEEALGAHVVVEGFEFTHALVRDTLYGDLSGLRRQRLHARAAQAIELTRGENAMTEVAHHWYAAGDRPHALASSVRAASAVDERYAHGEALDLYERALELWDTVDDPELLAGIDRVGLEERAAEAASSLGEPKRAEQLVEAALQRLDWDAEPMRAGLLNERLGRFRWIGGDAKRALEAYEAAVEVVPPTPPTRHRARVLAALAHALVISNQAAPARARSAEALAIARDVRAPVEEGRALATLGSATARLGQADEGLAMVLEGREKLRRANAAPDYIVITHSAECNALEDAARFEEAWEAARKGVAFASARGMHRNHRGWLEMQGASSLIKLGRWEEAMETLDAALARGPSGITRRGVQLMRAQLQVARGDVEGATNSAADAQRAVEGDQPFTGRMFHVLASLALERGDHDTAEQHVSRGLALLEPLDDVQAAVRLRLRGLQAQADRPDPTIAVAERLIAEVRAVTALDLPVAGAELPALRASCEAEFGRAIGRSDPASWSAAADAWETLGEPYPQAYSLMRAAEAAGRPDAEALDLARQLGTPRLIAALEALG